MNNFFYLNKIKINFVDKLLLEKELKNNYLTVLNDIKNVWIRHLKPGVQQTFKGKITKDDIGKIIHKYGNLKKNKKLSELLITDTDSVNILIFNDSMNSIKAGFIISFWYNNSSLNLFDDKNKITTFHMFYPEICTYEKVKNKKLKINKSNLLPEFTNIKSNTDYIFTLLGNKGDDFFIMDEYKFNPKDFFIENYDSYIENIKTKNKLYSEINECINELNTSINSILNQPIEENFDILDFSYINILLEKYVILNEANINSGTSVKIARSVDKKAKKIGHNLKKSQNPSGAAKHAKVALQKAPTWITNVIDDILNKSKEMDINERRNRIVENSYRTKFYKLIRNGVVLICTGTLAAAILNPVVGGIIATIALLAGIARDHKIDQRVKKQIINELELELKIVREKLDDSRGEGNRNAKYNLMRIENSLEKEIYRIQHNLQAEVQNLPDNIHKQIRGKK